MADFECCSSFTECNELITIGYLRDFIGSLLQNSSGAAIGITTTFPDTYCPTYDEIKALLPAHANGSSGPLDDVDGIILNGSGNSTVKQQELSIIYTRFSNFTITATTRSETCACGNSGTDICPCGGNSDFTYTTTLIRYTKSMNNNCDIVTNSSTVNDTQDSRVTFSTSNFGTVNGHSMSVGKNGDHDAPRRCTTITGKVTFRGSNKTDTDTVCQAALTGSYVHYYYDYSIYNKGVSCSSPSSFGCQGGSYSARAYYDRDDWEVVYWKDCCGKDYYEDNKEKEGSRTTVTNQTYDTYSGTFSNIQSTGGSDSDSVNWSGYGGCSWTQYCQAPPECNSNTDYGTGTGSATASCSGETVTVESTDIPYTAYTRHLDEENNCITEISYGTVTGETTVTVECNDTTETKTFTGTANRIAYTVTQEAGPCCPIYCNCGKFSIDKTSERWDASDTTVKDITITSTADCIQNLSLSTLTHYTATLGSGKISVSPRTTNTGNTAIVETLTISYDSVGTDVTEHCSSAVTLTHDKAACGCENFSLSPTVLGWEYNDTTSSSITISSGACIGNITLSTLTHFTATVANGVITVKPNGNNTGAAAITETLTVSYEADGASCPPITVTLTHRSQACDCGDFSIAPTAASWVYNDTSISSLTVSSGVCIADITLSSLTHFTATKGNGVITVKPNSNNTGTTTITETLTIDYKANGTTCPSKTVTLTHTPQPCDCGDFSITPVAATWEYNSTSISSLTVSSGACISDITLSSLTHFTATKGNGVITVKPNSNNTGTTAITETLTVTFKANGTECPTPITVTLTHNPQDLPPCDCTKVTITPKT